MEGPTTANPGVGPEQSQCGFEVEEKGFTIIKLGVNNTGSNSNI